MWRKKQEQTTASKSNGFDLFPSLAEVVKNEKLDVGAMTIGIPTDEEKNIIITDRTLIYLESKGAIGKWHVPSLREMFRGEKEAPDLEQYPDAYTPLFFEIESHLLSACDICGDITDNEFERIYSALRRRPDGKSDSIMHDIAYQAAAFILGLEVISRHEFEAIFSRLARSARTFTLGHSSRNYINYLRNTFA
jgi:hypothetical protein